MTKSLDLVSPATKGEVLLVGNYPPDRQRSMERFAQQILTQVANERWRIRLVRPAAVFDRLRPGNKWLGYLDKYILFCLHIWWLTHRPGARPVLVHIADHSNAVYSSFCGSIPVLATVHDLLAVRAGLGEDGTACRASRLGVLQQKWILRGLRGCDYLTADSSETLRDVKRLVRPSREVLLLPVAVGEAFRVLPPGEAAQAVKEAGVPADGRPYLFHVGSGHPRKNRAALVRVYEAMRRSGWAGRLVLAGAGREADLAELAGQSAYREDIVFLGGVSEAHLVALYNRAHCLLFPSYSEGFGWPCIEAGACGCPVIASNTTSLPEVVGEGGQVFAPDDAEGMAAAALRLDHPAERSRWAAAALANADIYSLARLAKDHRGLYEEMVAEGVAR